MDQVVSVSSLFFNSSPYHLQARAVNRTVCFLLNSKCLEGGVEEKHPNPLEPPHTLPL